MKSNANPNLKSSWNKIFIILKQVMSKFEKYRLCEINKIKLGEDNLNHNKLRFYSNIKECLKKNLHRSGTKSFTAGRPH